MISKVKQIQKLQHCSLRVWLYFTLSTPLLYFVLIFFNKIFVTCTKKEKKQRQRKTTLRQSHCYSGLRARSCNLTMTWGLWRSQVFFFHNLTRCTTWDIMKQQIMPLQPHHYLPSHIQYLSAIALLCLLWLFTVKPKSCLTCLMYCIWLGRNRGLLMVRRSLWVKSCTICSKFCPVWSWLTLLYGPSMSFCDLIGVLNFRS